MNTIENPLNTLTKAIKKRGFKDHEVDFYRWFALGIILLALAIGAMFYAPLMYIFAIIFVFGVIDIFYLRYFKYSAIYRTGK